MITYNGKIIKVGASWLTSSANPFLRFRFANTSYTPSTGSTSQFGSWTLVDQSTNTWDWVPGRADWGSAFYNKMASIGDVYLIGGNTSGATSLAYLFGGCSSLVSVSDVDFSFTKNLDSVFYNCTNLVNFSNVNFGTPTSTYGLFGGCSSIQTAPYVDVSSATSTFAMFSDCTSLSSIPYSMDLHSIDSNNGGVGRMFKNCSSLTSVPNITQMPVLYNAPGYWEMFYGCTHIVNSAKNIYDSLYAQAGSSTTTYRLDHRNAFYDCGYLSGSSQLSDIYRTWGGTKNGTVIGIQSFSSTYGRWTIKTSDIPTSIDVRNGPLYIHSGNLFTSSSPTLYKSSIYWVGTPLTGTLYFRPAFIQYTSASELSYVRTCANSGFLTYGSSDTTATPASTSIPGISSWSFLDRYYGSYDSSKTTYFCILVYSSMTNFGLQCGSLNSSPQLYWTL